MAKDNILILGVGNILYSDDGVGIKVVDRLNCEYSFPDNVNVVDGGVLGVNLLGVISAYTHLILIDTVLNKGNPGDLYRIEQDEIKKRIMPKNSLHQVDILEVLTLCSVLPNGMPKTVIIGIEPKDYTTLDNKITPEIENKVDDIMDMVFKELDALGTKYSKKDKKDKSEHPFWE